MSEWSFAIALYQDSLNGQDERMVDASLPSLLKEREAFETA